MNKILNHLRDHKVSSFLIGTLIIVISSFQVVISYLQVFSFEEIVIGNFKQFIMIEGISLSLWLLTIFLNHILTVYKEKVITKISSSLTTTYLEEVSKKSYINIMSETSKGYASKLTNDIELIETNGFHAFFSLMETIVLMIFSLFALFTFHYSLGVLTIFLTLVITYIPKIFTNQSQEILESYSQSKKEYLSKVVDIFDGISILFAASKLSVLNKVGKENVVSFNKSKIDYVRKNNSIVSIITVVSLLGQIILSVYTGVLAMNGMIPLGVILSVGNMAANVFNSLTLVSSSMLNINSITNIISEFETRSINNEKSAIGGEIDLIEISNLGIIFNHKSLLDNFNYNLEKGKKYAILGESGKGKTTLFNTILKRNLNYSGEIKINGKDIVDLSDQELAHKITFIEQNKYLFNTSIYNNITFWETLNNEDINRVLKACNISHLNLQKNAIEANLSEGEKQRVNLARMILLNKDVIFIDEGSSNLDRKTMIDVERNILTMEGKMIIMITHNLQKESKSLIHKVLSL